jgi:hypothetical protein
MHGDLRTFISLGKQGTVNESDRWATGSEYQGELCASKEWGPGGEEVR